MIEYSAVNETEVAANEAKRTDCGDERGVGGWVVVMQRSKNTYFAQEGLR